MKYFLRQISGNDDKEIELVCKMLASDYDPIVSPYLIYTDKNYSGYLAHCLSGSDDFLYAATDSDQNDDIIGFALCKQRGDTIVLTNIIIKQEYRGHDIGSALLRFVEEQANRKLYPDVFALDVFDHNKVVLRWYLRLGMIITGNKYWYNLMNYYNNELLSQSIDFSSQNSIVVVKDKAGFKQVFCNNTEVGTLINDDTLIIRSKPDHNILLEIRMHFQNSILFFGFITTEKHSFPLIDESFHMEMPFEHLKKIGVRG